MIGLTFLLFYAIFIHKPGFLIYFIQRNLRKIKFRCYITVTVIPFHPKCSRNQ